MVAAGFSLREVLVEANHDLLRNLIFGHGGAVPLPNIGQGQALLSQRNCNVGAQHAVPKNSKNSRGSPRGCPSWARHVVPLQKIGQGQALPLRF